MIECEYLIRSRWRWITRNLSHYGARGACVAEKGSSGVGSGGERIRAGWIFPSRVSIGGLAGSRVLSACGILLTPDFNFSALSRPSGVREKGPSRIRSFSSSFPVPSPFHAFYMPRRVGMHLPSFRSTARLCSSRSALAPGLKAGVRCMGTSRSGRVSAPGGSTARPRIEKSVGFHGVLFTECPAWPIRSL